ncbi:MAG: DUF1385 domain-containing protein [Clostridia bacterium]|nr:DUF1385 domain-containing protein [Clostridia bacterium]
MMRGPHMTAMAVRDPDGKIVLEKEENSVDGKRKIAKLPIIRGVVNFIASMRVGYKYLMRSAEIAMPEEVTEKKEESAEGTEGEAKKSSLLMNVIMVIASVLGIALAIGLFIMLPSFIYKWCAELLPFLAPKHPALHSLVKSVFEGFLKIAVLVGYMLLVRLMKDIKRTFQYHGAEHKTIFCYEHGKELTVENVRGERRFHPRCGTSFLILMLIVGIFISFLIDPISILAFGQAPVTWLRALIRLLLLPLMMGLGYELIKIAGKYDNRFTRIISAPGMWLQRITVLEPDDDMIECALAAFKEVIPKEEKED